MWSQIEGYFLKISQSYTSTDRQVEESALQKLTWQSYLLLPLLIIGDFITRGILNNCILSIYTGYIDFWNLTEFDEESKITEITNRPWLARIIGGPFVPLGWILGLLSLNLLNIITIFESLYLNLQRAYLPKLSTEQQEGLNKIFKPKTTLAYVVGMLPGLIIGAVLLNIRHALDGFTRGWNDAWFDTKKLRFKKYKNYVWYGFPGMITSIIPRILMATIFLSLRITYLSFIGFFEGLDQGCKSLLDARDKEFFKQDKLGVLGKAIGFALGYSGFKSIVLAGQIFVDSWEQLKNTIVFTHHLNFADHKTIALNHFPFKWLGLPGLVIVFPICIIQTLVTLSFRAIQQLGITWINYIILAYQKATLYSLNEEDAEFEFYQIQQNEFERKFGLIAWLLTLGWAFYIITYFASLAFIVLVETNIRMFYFTSIYLVELAFWDKKVSLANYPALASRDVFGLVGSLTGFILGTTVAFVITSLRFVFESFSGFIIGFSGSSIGFQQDENTNYQIGLSALGYGVGRILRANVLLPVNMVFHAYNLVYKDDNDALSFDKKHHFHLNSVDYVMGMPFSGLPSVVLALVFTFLVISWRMISESVKSFFGALPSALQFLSYDDPGRSKMAQYVFGFPGLFLAYIPCLLIGALAPIVSFYKWIGMVMGTRYENYQGNVEQLGKIKKLFGLLNNLGRTFENSYELTLDNVSENTNGGKGSFCFIGKILSLNQSSIEEIYMDKVLEFQKTKQAKLEEKELSEIKEAVKSKYSFWSTHHEARLNQTHQFVSRQLN